MLAVTTITKKVHAWFVLGLNTDERLPKKQQAERYVMLPGFDSPLASRSCQDRWSMCSQTSPQYAWELSVTGQSGGPSTWSSLTRALTHEPSMLPTVDGHLVPRWRRWVRVHRSNPHELCVPGTHSRSSICCCCFSTHTFIWERATELLTVLCYARLKYLHWLICIWGDANYCALSLWNNLTRQSCWMKQRMWKKWARR